jgi:hypothetical protein
MNKGVEKRVRQFKEKKDSAEDEREAREFDESRSGC